MTIWNIGSRTAMDRSYENLDEIERLVARFADCTLPCAEWTHRAHLTVALCYLRDYPPAEALRLVRDGIRRYNSVCGVVNSATGGYHETITRFYMGYLGKHLASLADRSDWVRVTNELVEQHGARDLPFTYYSQSRLMSSEARADWVPPDLRPLE